MLAPPNLIDYLTFLSSVVGVKPVNLPTVLSTATDGGVDFLTDLSQSWDTDQWVDYYCSDLTNGAPAVAIDSNDGSTLTFATDLGLPVSVDDQYAITSQWVLATLAQAQGTVNEAIGLVSPSLYTRAVYNLATHFMIVYSPDQRGQTWWSDKRAFFHLLDPALGVVTSTSSDSSSMSYLNPKQFEYLTLGDLQLMKTPYGREYLADAQTYGFEPWGMT